MEFRFGHLVDFATEDVRRKLILVGIFEVIHVPQGNPIGVHMGMLVAGFRAHVTEGSLHTLEVRFVDADGEGVVPPQAFPIPFVPELGGLGLRAQLIFPVAGLMVPHFGEYAFEFYEGGTRLGVIPLQFIEIPPVPPSNAEVG